MKCYRTAVEELMLKVCYTVFITSHFRPKSGYYGIFVFVGSVAKRAQTESFFDEDCRLAARISQREGFKQSTINYNSIFKYAYQLLKQRLRYPFIHSANAESGATTKAAFAEERSQQNKINSFVHNANEIQLARNTAQIASTAKL